MQTLRLLQELVMPGLPSVILFKTILSLSLSLSHSCTHTHRKIAHYSRVLLPWQSAPLSTLEAQRPPESSLHTTAC